MATTLKSAFGHEENLSRHLLESGAFEDLLRRAGVKAVGSGSLELPVSHGHKGRCGRLDIYQPTTAGVVIGEVQYGLSDSAHRERFDGYASSFANPVAIVWIAEEFRGKDLARVALSSVPVVCAQVKAAANGLVKLAVVGGARLSVLSLEKRIAKANKKAKELLLSAPVLDAVRTYIDNMVDEQKCCDFDLDNPECFYWSMTAEQVLEHVLETSSPALKPLFAKTWRAHYKRLCEVEASNYFVEWKKAAVSQVASMWAEAKPRAIRARVDYQLQMAA